MSEPRPADASPATAPVPPEVAARREFEPEYAWAPTAPADPAPLAGTALWLGIAGIGVSLFVGWGFPLGLGGLVVAAVAWRRPRESRSTTAWAIGLGAASLLYSAGWLAWALTRP